MIQKFQMFINNSIIGKIFKEYQCTWKTIVKIISKSLKSPCIIYYLNCNKINEIGV